MNASTGFFLSADASPYVLCVKYQQDDLLPLAPRS